MTTTHTSVRRKPDPKARPIPTARTITAPHADHSGGRASQPLLRVVSCTASPTRAADSESTRNPVR